MSIITNKTVGQFPITDGVELGIVKEDKPLLYGREINQAKLVNAINYVNFKEDKVILNLIHQKFSNIISLNAYPKPCVSDHIEIEWSESLELDLKSFKLLNLLIPTEDQLILVEPRIKRITATGVKLTLPDIAHDVNGRSTNRHPCKKVSAKLSQGAVILEGRLSDFNAFSFRVELPVDIKGKKSLFDPDTPLHAVFENEQGLVYEGACTIMRQTFTEDSLVFALRPIRTQAPRFNPKQFRSIRQKLSPLPSINFEHPFTKRLVNLQISDLSGSGFSLEESRNKALLIPGMVIDSAEICFGNMVKIKCKGQVVYSNHAEESTLRSGIAIIDMDFRHHKELSSLLQEVQDSERKLSNNVDLEELWKFFFETGFIYPQKYISIQTHKKKFQDTFKKLYKDSPDLALHFIHMDKSTISGHISMVRFYENAWLVHHHAASQIRQKKSGLIVLEQINRYINESSALPSANMKYVICYFRPENRFPNRIFGGCARSLNDPNKCSLDPQAYFHFGKKDHKLKDLPSGWLLKKTTQQDFEIIREFYEKTSGGLMMDAMDVKPNNEERTLDKQFKDSGLNRRRHFFSLKLNKQLKALLIINQSDMGLNMSDLTNCIQVIVADDVNFPKETLYSALSVLSKNLDKGLPVLMYPAQSADNLSIPHDKKYSFWVLKTQYFQEYLLFLKNYFKEISI